MDRILNSIEELRQGEVGRKIRLRMDEFRAKGRADRDEIFKELCFCLLTANYTSEGGIRIQKIIGDGFLDLPQQELALRLKELGYRFPNARSRYIVEARKHNPAIQKLLKEKGEEELRQWLSENVLGLGYKESSHFLRNIGFENLAIIDFHIVDLLAGSRLIRKPESKSLSMKRYIEIEKILARIAKASGISQGELDLYLWYIETGKILK